jgi:hypothetical protein
MKKTIIWVVEYEVLRHRKNGRLDVDYYKINIEPQVNQRGYNAAMVRAWYQRNNPDVKVIKVTVEKHEPGGHNILLGVEMKL